MYRYLLFSLIIIFGSRSFAQNDSLNLKKEVKKSFFSATILPATLILTGSLMSTSQFEKTLQKDIRNKVGNSYHNGMDDYIQYTPFLEVYIGDALGLNAKNHWFDQTKNMVIGGITTGIIIHSLKRIVGKERPDGSSNHSFPSGHTAASFTGATILFQEFRETNLLFASSGFLFSTTTGGLRIVNNRHYLSDVLAGAGIGILVANLVYYIEPLKNFNPFNKKKNNISFIPIIDNEEVTFVATFKF
jgi:hypothetical protein